MSNEKYTCIEESDMPDLLKEIFKKSQTDLKFRQLCIDDVGQAVFQLTGKKLPENAKLNFKE